MPTLAQYADVSYVHEKYHFHSKLRQRKSISWLRVRDPFRLYYSSPRGPPRRVAAAQRRFFVTTDYEMSQLMTNSA